MRNRKTIIIIGSILVIMYNKCVKRIVYETSHTRRIDFLALKLDWGKIIG
mgnify:FL=1|jgi:hypothetical protein